MEHSRKSPFGNPDGAVGPFEDDVSFVMLDARFGPAARPAAENSRTRVIAGTQGVGKTLLLRRLNEYFQKDSSVYATATLKGRELDTDTVVRFSQLFSRTTNTEMWTILWDRAIHASAAMHLLLDTERFGDVPPDHRAELSKGLPPKLRGARSPWNPIEVAAFLARDVQSKGDYRKRLLDSSWIELANSVQQALRYARELYLFIDAVDDNYRYAPTYWQQCQRGLFHAVMDTQHTDVESSKLHVVISIRDLTLSSVARSEHASRYLNNDTILALTWSWEACSQFLERKLEQLPKAFFPEDSQRTLAALLGRDTITNSVRGVSEPIEQYFLRHTRLSPRDIISAGNALSEMSVRESTPLWEIDDAVIRAEIAKVAKANARSALAQAGNQVLANVMPWNAARHSFAEFYVSADEYTADAMIREMCSVLLTVPGERFDSLGRQLLEGEAESRFGANCHFVDVLWQNRIIGVKEGDKARFYSGALTDEVAAPEAETYLLNSLVVDLLPGIELNNEAPVFPGGTCHD